MTISSYTAAARSVVQGLTIDSNSIATKSAKYSVQEKILGKRKVRQITMNDKCLSRRLRYFFSAIKAFFVFIGSGFSKKKIYMLSETQLIRHKYDNDEQNVIQNYNQIIGSNPQVSGGDCVDSKFILNEKESNKAVEQCIKYVMKNPAHTGREGSSLFYEMRLSTAIKGITTEPHSIVLSLDPKNKRLYVLDSKGVDPDKLYFYHMHEQRVVEFTVGAFIDDLLSREYFKDYQVVIMPSFQRVGDCSPASEALNCALSAIRSQSSDQTSQNPEREVLLALAMVNEHYELVHRVRKLKNDNDTIYLNPILVEPEGPIYKEVSAGDDF